MKKLVECVPNFSEGKDKDKIARIAKTIEQCPVKLLDTSSDANHNRTVVTFAGEPDEVKDAAFAAIKTATQLIDMSTHRGEHPRLGAVDVCPFIPVNSTMEECVRLARDVGSRVGSELGIPVYLYGAAATSEKRKVLADIRKGEYEGLERKLAQEEWKPDYGPAVFNRRSGAIVVGARPILIAFNVNLKTQDITVANRIAGRIRESGRVVRGNRVPGLLKCVQALGVPLREQGLAQVSINLLDYRTTGLYQVFKPVQTEVQALGVHISHSEIIGLVPEAALLEKSHSIEQAIDFLKIKDFAPSEKVLEYRLRT